MELPEAEPLSSRDSQSVRILFPRVALSGLLFAAVIRDTRGVRLEKEELFNHFPASPMCAITWVRVGRLHLVDDASNVDPIPLQNVFVTGACRRPLISWSPDSVYAMTIGFYPDALGDIAGVGVARLRDQRNRLEEVFVGDLLEVFRSVSGTDDFEAAFDQLQRDIERHWRNTYPGRASTPPRMEDWARALAARAAVSGVGARQMQRTVKAWTGATMRELRKHARVERLFARSRRSKSLAEMAADGGYADQSHMGREVRSVTGASPAKIGRLIATDARYWFYRAVGEHVRGSDPTE